MNTAQILAAVSRYHQTSTQRLHLIPSENSMSLAARIPYLTDVVHRYSFPPSLENSAWPGNEDLALIEDQCRASLATLFGAKHANVKPISGLNCMAVAISALTQPGDTVLSIADADGGHAATRGVAGRLGLQWRQIPYDSARYSVDIERLARLVSEIPGRIFLYLDQFMCLFPHDLKAIRAVVGPHTVIHYDGSHVMGLIAGGQFQDPLAEGADSFGGSVHKTFPGPHKGLLLTNHDDIARLFDDHSGFWVSHHHPADVAALAITAAELHGTIGEYAKRTIDNARRLGQALAERGLLVCAEDRGFTDSHQLWIDVAPNMSPADASRALLRAGVVVNAIDIPYLESGGLRLGVQELTRLGMGADEMVQIADIFRRVVVDQRDPEPEADAVRDLLSTFASDDEAIIDQLIARACSPAGASHIESLEGP